MPFIRGRYHINAIMGEALEAAREAEAALLALKQNARQHGDSAQDEDDAGDNAVAAKGPVHRVEIEAAEMVPSHSGRGLRGYAMRIHRMPPPSVGDPDADFADVASINGNSGSGTSSRYGSRNSSAVPSASQSDTHIFSNHNDMLDYLRDELADDSAGG